MWRSIIGPDPEKLDFVVWLEIVSPGVDSCLEYLGILTGQDEELDRGAAWPIGRW